MKLAGIHLIWKCQQRDRTAFQIISGYFCDLPNGMMTRVPDNIYNFLVRIDDGTYEGNLVQRKTKQGRNYNLLPENI